MAEHVCNKVAPPKIKHRQDRAKCERDNDVGPSAGPMAERKNQERNCRCPRAVQTQRLQTFNRVTAKKTILRRRRHGYKWRRSAKPAVARTSPRFHCDHNE